MITVKAQKNLGNAKSYFRDHLNRGDYHSQDKVTRGFWMGKGASMLGLSGEVEERQFTNLCDNLHPQTSEPLTVRQKAERRVFYDFVISPPKSVSVAALVGQDDRITRAHERAIKAAVNELEELTMTRVRSQGGMTDRETGNMAAAVFRHETSRSVVTEKGDEVLTPDPHLHSHVVVFNATFDAEEDRWKAVQNSEMLRAQKFVEGVYFHELRREVERMGYAVEENGRGGFELSAIPESVRERFSKRHDQIQRRAEEVAAGKGGGNIKDFAEHVARNERARKTSEISDSELRASWSEQMSSAERAAVHTAVSSARGGNVRSSSATSKESVSWAMEHVFERRAVVRDHEIWREALGKEQGTSVEVSQLKKAFAERSDIKRVQRNVTTEKIIAQEKSLLSIAESGKGKVKRSDGPLLQHASNLSAEQRAAVTNLATSPDRVNILIGKAGTGKSHTLKALTSELEARNGHVVVVAPQARQVQDLEKDGLRDPQTVSSFLRKGELPKGSVVIVDEAGQLGTVSMLKLAKTVEKAEGQLILCGDSRQHGPVERGDALRSLEIYSKVRTVKLEAIRRQDPQRGRTAEEKSYITQYRESVLQASEGNAAKSFAIAEQLGAIKEAAPSEKLAAVTDRAKERMLANENCLVVSQTRAEVSSINEKLRTELQQAGKIGSREKVVEAFTTVDLTEAQKKDARSYQPGAKVVPFEKIPRLKVGNAYVVEKADEKGVHVKDGETSRTISWEKAFKWQVVQPQPLSLAEGDQLQIKGNHRGDSRLTNGEIVHVKSVDRNGAVHLKDGRAIPEDFRLFQRGYAVTSYGGQGKTVDHILISDAGEKGASNARQWYVDQSRGRLSFEVFTSDKEGLKERIQRTGDPSNALDMMPPDDQNQNNIPKKRLFPGRPQETKKPQQEIRGGRELDSTGREKTSHQADAGSAKETADRLRKKHEADKIDSLRKALSKEKSAERSQARNKQDQEKAQQKAKDAEKNRQQEQTRSTAKTNEASVKPASRIQTPEERYRNQGRGL